MTTAISTASSANAPLNITGLASGLNTNEIITALLAAEREPVTRLTNKQTALEAQSAELQRREQDVGGHELILSRRDRKARTTASNGLAEGQLAEVE